MGRAPLVLAAACLWHALGAALPAHPPDPRSSLVIAEKLLWLESEAGRRDVVRDLTTTAAGAYEIANRRATATDVPLGPPSEAPTLASPLPTLILPSPPPTIQCGTGTFFDGTVCTECSIGRHQPINDDGWKPPWPRNCSLCPAGTFNTHPGQISCSTCDIGKLSSPQRTYCIDCKAGGYNFEDKVSAPVLGASLIFMASC